MIYQVPDILSPRLRLGKKESATMEHSTEELVASFFRTKAAAYASPTTVKAWMDSGNQDFVLVDVRLRGAARTWQIPGSLEIPATQMGERLNELPKDKMIVLYCWDTWCSLATTAAVVLADHGYRVKELFGGVAAWQVLHLPEERIGESTVPPSPACAC
jgi:rhodanese-related sulfurtransferase